MATKKQDRKGPLHAWLERVGAQLGYQVDAPNGRSRLSIYSVNGRPFVVTEHLEPAGSGWDIFVPASNENNVAKTLDGAALALGVDGCAGLV